MKNYLRKAKNNLNLTHPNQDLLIVHETVINFNQQSSYFNAGDAIRLITEQFC